MATSAIKKELTSLQKYDIKLKQMESMPKEQLENIIQLFSEFCTLEAIRHSMIMSFGEEAVGSDVWIIEKITKNSKYKWEIQERRDKYLNRLKDLAISHKRVRLEDLQYLRDRYIVQIRGVGDNTPEERQEFKYMAYGLAQILAQAQDEVEGKGMNINVGLGVFDMGDLDGKSDQELISRRQELLAKAERAIGIGSSQRPRIARDNTDSKNVIDTQTVQPS